MKPASETQCRKFLTRGQSNENYVQSCDAGKKGVIFININPIIEKAFSDFKIGEKSIPIAFLSYTGKADTYLTYYTWQEQPDDFYDDENHAEIAFATIDIFSKGNFKNILKKVKTKLKEIGFAWTDNVRPDRALFKVA